MKDEIVKFETALLAEQKGFDLATSGRYSHASEDTTNSTFIKCVFMPTQSLLQRWLREKHGIVVESRPLNNLTWWDYYIWDKDMNRLFREVDFISYEEALEEGLIKALKLLK